MRPSVRSLDQILSELGTVYTPQINSLQTQMSLIPEQVKAEEEGLKAKQTDAFGDILSGARQRGLGFSGIPLADQAKYTASTYMPALANLRTAGKQQTISLQDAINSIYEKRQNAALAQQNYEQQRQDAYDSEQRQLAASRASSGSSLGDYLAAIIGNQTQVPATTPAAAKMGRDAKGNFWFNDAAGKNINAAQYAALTGTGYRKLLSQMATAGDKNAQVALKFVGNDALFGNAPQQYAGALSALGAKGTYAKPVAKTTPKTTTTIPNYSNVFATNKLGWIK